MTSERGKRSYSTGPQVRKRYGGRSQMWLWRKLKYDPKFPRPLLMGKNLRLFDDAELDLTTTRSAPTRQRGRVMEKLPLKDELRRLIGMLGDIVDGIELVQALYADPLIEAQLADLRYATRRLTKLLIE